MLRVAGCGGLLALLLSSTAVMAQEAGDEPTLLGEIVVTAQRQAQRLQDVPVAVTALDGRALEARSVATLDNVATFTPNIRFDAAAQLSGASYNATVFIRGVGQNDFAIFSDPGVGIYVDEVYYARSIGGIMDAVDLESVQVLRGPQGTLFGKNTIGGAVLITTRKPTQVFEGSIEVTTGRYDRADAKAVLNVPIVEGVLAGRLTLATVNRDGYVKRLSDGSDQGDRNADLARAQLRWTPSERLSVDLAYDYSRAREHRRPTS
jgi:iron complex outermembrane recepter protein